MYRFCLSVACVAVAALSACAQQVTVAAPLQSASDSFYENFGVGFGLRYDSPGSRMFFHNGLGTAPAFGGFDPNAQWTIGLAGRRGNWSWNLGLSASQGSSRSSVTTTPMLTLPNGGFGALNHTTTRPFVTGIIPVVNDQRRFQRLLMQHQFRIATLRAQQKRRAEEERESQLIATALQHSEQKPKRSKSPMEPPLVLIGSPSAENAVAKGINKKYLRGQ